ncbi:hypothetical protein MASR2M48_11860 [Spirochaetota bacterium]
MTNDQILNEVEETTQPTDEVCQMSRADSDEMQTTMPETMAEEPAMSTEGF